MLSTPLSRFNISCTCTECTTFLRPFPKDPLPTLLPTGLFLPNSAFSLPSTPALTPNSSPQGSPRLVPTALALGPSPHFLLMCPPSRHSGQGHKPALLLLSTPLARRISVSVNDQAARMEKVTRASRSLWAVISSPLDEGAPLLSAKTLGLALCGSRECARKFVPEFGRGVCGECDEEIRGAVLRLAVLLEEEQKEVQVLEARRDNAKGISPSNAAASEEGMSGEEPELHSEGGEVRFALPSTPPGVQLMRMHSLSSIFEQYQSEERDGPSTRNAAMLLFALPNVSLDAGVYEEMTPTTRHAMNFPVLPTNGHAAKENNRDVSKPRSASKTGSRTASINPPKAVSQPGSKRDSREILMATESTPFSLRASNSSMKWRLREI